MLANWLSNRIFDHYDAIVGAVCDAWKKFTQAPEMINRDARLGACGLERVTVGMNSDRQMKLLSATWLRLLSALASVIYNSAESEHLHVKTLQP